MASMVNWNMMTQPVGVSARIDELFDTVFTRGDMTSFAKMTVMGWNALDHETPLARNPATPWLVTSKTKWRKRATREDAAAPKVDVTEVPSGLLIVLRLPRLVRDSVYIGVRDNILTVTGEQAVPPAAESTFGQNNRRFQRNFSLPPAPTPHDIKAYCHGEVLRIIVSKNR